MYGNEERSPDYDSDYVALSHAWGGADFTKLTSQSYTRLCDEFSMDELPQTWRDAIHLTRSLGYRFIWIDALCIIQDSLYDWEVEAASMGQVYANCDLNIAALSGTTSHDGLFQYRDIAANFPCDITDAIGGDNWPEGQRLHSAMIRRDDSDLAQETGPGSLDYVTEMVNGSLNKRGWVLQERAFSPRTLYFSKSSLFWDCRSLELDEFPSIAATDVELASRENFNLKKGLPFNHQINSSKEVEQVFETWYKLLKIYCASGLTFETDRLLAISGIAKLVAKKTKSDYYAGIWEHKKLQDLLWCVSEPVSVHREREDELPDPPEDVDKVWTKRLLKRQVSFSWASIGGPVAIHWPYHALSQAEGVEILFRAQIQGFVLPPRPTAFTSVNWNDDTRFERAVAGSFSISCPVHKFGTAEVSDWDEARRKVGQEILAAGLSLSGMPVGVRYFPDRTEAYSTTICRASLAHSRLAGGSIADFGLILSPAKTDLQGRVLYKRLGMYYDLYGKGDTYSKFRRGFYRNGNVVVI
ncbi:heterokaryon incompatibility protein [Colletotrichum plurivorum]|uniref:Heterokaryon incompatibility protein n=1 Tax=Colletotrichum plurivorum TaxID=2175906 RepID=A0A8H6JLM6_9PEZI|nr:heterokaryon incompatibility protein [Colletotrichum plurivorum]